VAQVDRSWTADFGAFIKRETYAPDKAKATRNIIAPDHFMRGVQFLLCHTCQDGFFDHYNDFCIKHRDESGIRRTLLSKFQGCGTVFETDHTSFESCQGLVHMEGESHVMMAYAPANRRKGIEALYQRVFCRPMIVRSQDEDLKLPVMRASGTFVTSFGNFINNFAFCSMLVRELETSLGLSASRLISRSGWLALFEGDDGVFAPPPTLVMSREELKNHLDRAAVRLGLNLKLDVSSSIADAHFCGNKLLCGVGGFFAKLKDYKAVLSACTTILGPDLSSGAHRMMIQYATCLSFYGTYERIPLVGPVIRSLALRCESELKSNPEDFGARATEAMRTPTEFGRWMRSYAARHDTPSPLVIERMVSIAKRIHEKPNPDLSLSAHVAAEFQVSSGDLHLLEANAIQAISRVIPGEYPRTLLADAVEKATPLWARVKTFVVKDTRELAKRYVAASSTAVQPRVDEAIRGAAVSVAWFLDFWLRNALWFYIITLGLGFGVGILVVWATGFLLGYLLASAYFLATGKGVVRATGVGVSVGFLFIGFMIGPVIIHSLRLLYHIVHLLILGRAELYKVVRYNFRVFRLWSARVSAGQALRWIRRCLGYRIARERAEDILMPEPPSYTFDVPEFEVDPTRGLGQEDLSAELGEPAEGEPELTRLGLALVGPEPRVIAMVEFPDG